MAESNMRQLLIERLKPLNAIAVENSCPSGVGTPDVNYADGTIELKWLRAWPKRPETPVRLDHPLTKGQRLWHYRRRKAGGQAWVMLQHQREWLLFDGAVAAVILGSATRQELIEGAYRYWDGILWWELIDILRDAPLRTYKFTREEFDRMRSY